MKSKCDSLLKRTLVRFVMMMLLSTCIGVQVLASEQPTNKQDGLQLQMKTDKTKYEKNDEVQLELTVTNESQQEVKNVELQAVLPEALEAVDKSSLRAEKSSLKAGEKLSVKVTAKAVYIESGVKTGNSTNANPSTVGGGTSSIPVTGDTTPVIFWIVTAAICLITFMITFKYRRKAMKMLSLFICMAMILPLLSHVNVDAKEIKKTFSVNNSISYVNDTYELQGVVTYVANEAEISTDLITIDTKVFSKSEAANYYVVNQKLDAITGTLDASLMSADEFSLEIKNAKNDVILNKDIQKTRNWSASEIGLFPGLNLISVRAVYQGKVYVKQIELFNSSKENVNGNLNIDLSDTDGDGLLNYVEQQLGTNINKADTDGDGLKDYQEVVILETNPLVIDTNKNGISDFDEDADGDGLSNGLEIQKGTNPVLSDTDGDLLSDGEEINQYKTNPLSKDTDGDKGLDGWEVHYGFNPLVPNTSFTVTEGDNKVSKNEPVKAVVEVTSSGEQLGTISVTPVNSAENPLLPTTIAGYLGSAYKLSASGPIQKADLSMYYDTSLGSIGSNFQPRIYYFNEQTGGFEELPNQTVENGCVKATLTHFSYYILLNKVELDKVWKTDIKDPIVDEHGKSVTIDVAFACDVSGSMSGSKLDTAKTAINQFIDQLEEKDRAGLIKFESYSSILSDLTTNKNSIKPMVSSLYASGGTAIYNGFSNAVSLFNKPDKTYGYKMAIILTDGVDEPSTSYDAYYKSLVEQAIKNKIVIYTIGVGSSVDTTLLKKIAESTGGAYYPASTASDISGSFTQIRGDSVDLTTDSNSDGIPDYYNDLIKKGELVLTNGSTEFSGIDFNYDKNGNPSDDYDGDGLKNGQELIVKKDAYGRVTMQMLSNPTLVYSDSDTLTDKQEYGVSNPLKYDYNSNAVEGLANNSNYYYEDLVSLYDNDKLFSLDSAFLSAVFGVWNTGELYRDNMIDYFDSYAKKQYLEETERKNTVDILVGALNDIYSKVKDKAMYAKDFRGNVHNLIDVIRGCKSTTELRVIINTRFVAIFQQLEMIHPELGKITISNFQFRSYTEIILEKYSKLEPLKMGELSKLGAVLNVVDAGIDVADTIGSLAKVRSNNEAFENNLDILTELKNNGGRINTQKAAEKILKLMSEKFGDVYASEITGDIGEGALNLLLTIASMNPYVAAVVFARDSIAIITGISEDLKQQYQVLCYSDMVAGVENCISSIVSKKGNFYYVPDGREANMTRYLTHLAQLRICGEKKYCEFQANEGLLGSHDNSRVENMVAQTIKYTIERANTLHIQLNTNLLPASGGGGGGGGGGAF